MRRLAGVVVHGGCLPAVRQNRAPAAAGTNPVTDRQILSYRRKLCSAGGLTRGKRPTNPIFASLVSLVAGVFRSPNFFRGRSWSGQSSGGGVFLRISSSQGGRCGSVVSRHRDGPATMLKGWSGFLHADNWLT